MSAINAHLHGRNMDGDCFEMLAISPLNILPVSVATFSQTGAIYCLNTAA
ncbi:MAG: hypothetical protein WA922_01475 [Pontixanthobacter sp.]